MFPCEHRRAHTCISHTHALWLRPRGGGRKEVQPTWRRSTDSGVMVFSLPGLETPASARQWDTEGTEPAAREQGGWWSGFLRPWDRRGPLSPAVSGTCLTAAWPTPTLTLHSPGPLTQHELHLLCPSQHPLRSPRSGTLMLVPLCPQAPAIPALCYLVRWAAG